MTFPSASRPVLLSLTALVLSGCGGVEGDPHRFENMARAVANIDVPLQPGVSVDAPSSSVQAGLRPALQVQVMDPHDLWDARDAGLRGAVTQVATQAATRAAAEAAPAVADAVVRRVSAEIQSAPALRPALSGAKRTTIQLGAFSSEAAARDAWAEVSAGAGRGALRGLEPVFEAVNVNGKRFTRLKVGPIPVEAAAGLCRAAEVADPWCRRAR